MLINRKAAHPRTAFDGTIGKFGVSGVAAAYGAVSPVRWTAFDNVMTTSNYYCPICALIHLDMFASADTRVARLAVRSGR